MFLMLLEVVISGGKNENDATSFLGEEGEQYRRMKKEKKNPRVECMAGCLHYGCLVSCILLNNFQKF